ncbi:MAG: hypothetical protein AB1652_08185 [Bacillota bacterium]
MGLRGLYAEDEQVFRGQGAAFLDGFEKLRPINEDVTACSTWKRKNLFGSG